MKLNILKLSHLVRPRPRTYEGAPAPCPHTRAGLRRSVLACMLWENEFYEDGVNYRGAYPRARPQGRAGKVAALAIEARTAMKLRHVAAAAGARDGASRHSPRVWSPKHWRA